MRIIAGSRKGHRIAAPKGRATRPTGDRVREAAFNLIGPVDGAAVLDLYAGSGAMGLEALSRGAASAVFVESDREGCRVIARNLEKLRLTGATVLCRDVLPALAGQGVVWFVVGLGGTRDNRPRQRLFELALAHGLTPLTVLHASATVSHWATIGAGIDNTPSAVSWDENRIDILALGTQRSADAQALLHVRSS